MTNKQTHNGNKAATKQQQHYYLELHDLVLGDRLAEGVVVARVVREARAREPDRVRAHAVQKVLRVADDDEALFVLGQEALEPHARLEVL